MTRATGGFGLNESSLSTPFTSPFPLNPLIPFQIEFSPKPTFTPSDLLSLIKKGAHRGRPLFFYNRTNITRHWGLFMQACTCMHAPAATSSLEVLSYLTPANSKIWRDFLTIPLKTTDRKSGGGVPPLRARKLPDSNSSIRQFNNSSIYLTSLFSHE
jgi:hypothetical protein